MARYYHKFQTLHPPAEDMMQKLHLHDNGWTTAPKTGPIQSSFPMSSHPISEAWIEAFDRLGCVASGSSLSGRSHGGLITTCAVAHGERSHAGIAYFASAAARPNLHLMDHSMCERVVFDDSKMSPRVATAVQFVRNGEHYIARFSKEVVICAGAFQSPQVLELSGIGAKDLLSSYGIGLVHENPYVGGTYCT